MAVVVAAAPSLFLLTFFYLKDRYEREIKPQLRGEFSYGNVMQVPRMEKVIVNIGLGEAISNPKAMDAAAGDLATRTNRSILEDLIEVPVLFEIARGQRELTLGVA